MVILRKNARARSSSSSSSASFWAPNRQESLDARASGTARFPRRRRSGAPTVTGARSPSANSSARASWSRRRRARASRKIGGADAITVVSAVSVASSRVANDDDAVVVVVVVASRVVIRDDDDARATMRNGPDSSTRAFESNRIR